MFANERTNGRAEYIVPPAASLGLTYSDITYSDTPCDTSFKARRIEISLLTYLPTAA